MQMNYPDINNFSPVEYISNCFILEIKPFIYLDGRNPRLPRKSSKGYDLKEDIKFYFSNVFYKIKTEVQVYKFAIEIIVYNGKDKLGKADLDNYCKAILDGITHTQKVWKDDKQVDELYIKRENTQNEISYITLKIYPYNNKTKS